MNKAHTMASNSNMSSVSEDADEMPVINSDTSKGSSVSTDMQDEYNELLKYAVVIPKWTQPATPGTTDPHGEMPMLRLQDPHDVPLTTVDQYSASSSSASSQSNDGHDSAMGSDEILTDRKTFREPDLKEHHSQLFTSTTSIQAVISSQSSKIDPDVAQMNEQLKTWNVKFNNMVLSEFNQAKLGVVEHFQKLLHDKEMEHQAQVNKLQDEIENMKELLHTYETSLARKDSVISNLTRALQTSKERQDMLKALSQWKLRMNDERRQAFTTNLARRHRERTLATRAWQSWRSLVEGNWREKVEKACQKKAKEVCMQLTDDYEERMVSMNDILSASRAEVQRLNDERERYEETMKKAFMRGVCALNLEAMSMFQNEEGAENDVESLSVAVNALSQNHGDHPPTKSHGSRPITTSQSYPSMQQHGPAPATVISQSVPSLPLSNSSLHAVTSHARNQVTTNAAPSHSISTKFPVAKSRRVAGGKPSTAAGRAKSKLPQTLTGIPANVLVKRHQPNLQNYVTHQPLKHMTKYPNTPVRPISGK